MTPRRSPESPSASHEGRFPADREPTVLRPHEEPSWAEDLWARQNDPHRPENHHLSKRFYGQLMGSLDDASFMISMRNRLLGMKPDREAPEFWRRIRELLFGASEVISLSGFEITRLMHLAGQEPPNALPGLTDVDTTYDCLMRLVSDAELHMAAPDKSEDGAVSRPAGPGNAIK